MIIEPSTIRDSDLASLFKECHFDALKNESEEYQNLIKEAITKETNEIELCYRNRNRNRKKYDVIFECKFAGFYSVYEDDDILWIFNVLVKPKFQGKGIGTRIIEKIIQDYPNKTIRLITLSHLRPAIHLYKKFGFRIVELSEWLKWNWSDDILSDKNIENLVVAMELTSV